MKHVRVAVLYLSISNADLNEVRTMNQPEFDQILKRREVEMITGLSRSELYRRLKTGEFPAQVRLGPKSVGWRMSAIQTWIKSLQQTA